MNRDKNTLIAGQDISFSQLDNEMIVDFTLKNNQYVDNRYVTDAIIVVEGHKIYAVHDNPEVNGNTPTKKFGKKFGWLFDGGIQWCCTDIVFRGWYKPEEKPIENKDEEAPMYKIGDMVKCDHTKCEVIGFHEDLVWLKYKGEKAICYSYWTVNRAHLSPWIEPINKFKKGDLVVLKDGDVVEILNVAADGIYYDIKNVVSGGTRFHRHDSTFDRKIGETKT